MNMSRHNRSHLQELKILRKMDTRTVPWKRGLTPTQIRLEASDGLNSCSINLNQLLRIPKDSRFGDGEAQSNLVKETKIPRIGEVDP